VSIVQIVEGCVELGYLPTHYCSGMAIDHGWAFDDTIDRLIEVVRKSDIEGSYDQRKFIPHLALQCPTARHYDCAIKAAEIAGFKVETRKGSNLVYEINARDYINPDLVRPTHDQVHLYQPTKLPDQAINARFTTFMGALSECWQPDTAGGDQ
jgi:hypothetical protein